MVRLIRFVLAAAVMAVAAPASRAQDLPPIKEVVSFGDSLTDAGTYWFRFTTNPGLTWAQLVALHYGQAPLPNEHIDNYGDVYKGNHGFAGPGGLNYAEGGSKANSPYSAVSQDPEGKPISTVVQLKHYLKQHDAFRPDQLVTLYVGTNDVAYDYDPGNNPDVAKQLRDDRPVSRDVMAAQTARVEKAADDAAATATEVLAHGAKRLLVFKLFDLANAPWFHSKAARAFVHELGDAYNRRLVARLPRDPRILVIDTEAFTNDLIANAAAKGFMHGAHEDACREPDQDYCYPTTLASPDADRTYIFVAGEHMTTHTNELLAEYVIKQVEASALK